VIVQVQNRCRTGVGSRCRGTEVQQRGGAEVVRGAEVHQRS